MTDADQSSTRSVVAGVVVFVGLAGALTLPGLACPGLYYDEVLFVDGWTATRCAWCPYGLPVMTMSYLGAVKTWVYWPVQDYLSPSMVRAPWVLLALLSGVISVATAHRVSRRAALFAAALIFTDPAYLYFQRLDWGPVAIGILLRAIVLGLLCRWQDAPTTRTFALIGLACGVGVYDKLNFGWFLAGILVALVIHRRRFPAVGAGMSLAGVSMLGLGCLPLLAYNLAHPLVSLRSNTLLASGSAIGIEWGTRLRLIAETLSGEVLYAFVNQRPIDGGWTPYLFLVAPIAVLASPSLRRDPRVLLLVWSTAAVFVALLVVANVGPHHVPTLFPGVHVLAAVALSALAERGRMLRRVTVALVAVVVLANSVVDVRTASAFGSWCGKGRWSDAIYAVADFVRAHRDDRVLVADWGFSCQLRALTPDAYFEDVSWMLLEDPERAWRTVRSGEGPAYVILHDERATVMPAARAKLIELARRDRVEMNTVAAFRDREEVPVVEILLFRGSRS